MSICRRGAGRSLLVIAIFHFVAIGGEESRDPADAVTGLDVAPGLEATLFAAEPTIVSPTNLDIDERGRVWVCEVKNYRGNNGRRPEGDRILILEDTDGDGVADVTTVFHQGRDIDSAMGICVLGSRVIVSASPNIFILHDDDGDDHADRKEVFFSSTGAAQHDHSAHSFIFGPDGKLYWNFGNTGRRVHGRDGNPVVDLTGNEVVDNGRPYFGGMVFRCDPDGGRFEVLAHNFRNNYEVAVDSFGTLWQSDNDDDGNRGVRINYVMEFGNFGYRDERTGAGWQSRRTGMHPEIPLRHWHQNDPGVVPNLLQTGAGSPTGICVYEGRLLPEVFRDQVIHCDAGPNVVRAYPVAPEGAGYSARIADILVGTRDRWFRPADVCVAPDGSLFVTDWYDPGVGGHAQGDLERGRIFRVAPKGRAYRVPRFDFETPAGAVEALRNPNLTVRYLAWTALHGIGAAAEPLLLELYRSSEPRLRARALWLLAKIEGRGAAHVERGLRDGDPDIRITALRAARQIGLDVVSIVDRLAGDASPAVRRECAIALRECRSPRVPELWAKLAIQHDGADRWYLEALGIGAHGRWDECLEAWLGRVGDAWRTPGGRDIVWRSRAAGTASRLGRIIADPSVPADELPRYFRSFDFLDGDAAVGKDVVLADLAFTRREEDPARRRLVARESLERVRAVDTASDPDRAAALDAVLEELRGSAEFVELVAKFGYEKRYPDLLEAALGDPEGQLGVDAARALLEKRRVDLFRPALDGADPDRAARAARVLGSSGHDRAAAVLLDVLRGEERPFELRRQAARALARSRRGAEELLRLARADELRESLRSAAAFELHRAPWKEVRESAAALFPLPAARDDRPLPSIAELLRTRGDPGRGREVFNRPETCSRCHVVRGEGKQVGPELTEIGSKLGRDALLESILFPSAGISHGYESWLVTTKSGEALAGIITSETPEEISVKAADAIVRTVKTSEVLTRAMQDVSLMPEDLQKLMTAQDLADVVAYLETLRKE